MTQVIIKNHSPELAPHFKRLNVEWLKKYFTVEPIDEKYFEQTEEIIKKGGHIIYAEYQGDIIGCCALLHHGNKVYELAKMGVTERAQGTGTGKLLLLQIDRKSVV